jgi:succinylglutamate desuccinylase
MSAPDEAARDFLGLTLSGATPATRHGTTPRGLWRWHEHGLLEFGCAAPRASVVLSAGIHGDETAPIELLAQLAKDIASGAAPLAARVLLVLGHPGAMRAAVRYLSDDLNRLFRGRHRAMPASEETLRAAVLEDAVARFFDASTLPRWHFDMHTAIRASRFERFALLPHREPGRPDYVAGDFTRLAGLGIEAVLLHREAGNTFSQHCSSAHGAFAATLELGKVMGFGQNDLSRFAGASAGLRAFLADPGAGADQPPPRVFEVVATIVRRTQDGFTLFADDATPNFTRFERGALVARDTGYAYRTTRDSERIVFPNPRVRPGLRAALMVAEFCPGQSPQA